MGLFATKGEHYRVRAVELHAIAETMKDKDARRSLLTVAEDYQRMADQMERLEKELK